MIDTSGLFATDAAYDRRERDWRFEDTAIPQGHLPIHAGAPVKRLIALGCAVTLSFSAFCGFVMIDMGKRDYERARTEAVNLVATISADVARKMELIDLSLRAVQDGLKLPDLDRISPAILNLVLFDHSATAPDMGSILVLDRNGSVKFEARSLIPRPDNFAQADFFTHHRNIGGDGLFIGAPFRSKRGTWLVGISRRVDDSSGNFDGVIVAGLQLSYFYDLFKVVSIAPGDKLTVFRDDGIVLMRWPFDASFVGRDLSGIQLFTQYKKYRANSYELNFATDNVRRIAAYHQAGDKPLIVTFGRSVETIYAEGRARAWIIGSVVIALCIFNMGLVIFLARSLNRRAIAEQKLAVMATTDSLTGLCNRRRFDEILDYECRRAQRDSRSVALLLIDVDNFKQYNDQFGHQTGDAVLMAIARCIEVGTRRPADIAARYGGEEFAVLLPGLAIKDAFDLAERIRKSVAALSPDITGLDVTPTVSIGVAAGTPVDGLSPEFLVMAADKALYRAKASGRNCTVRAAFAGVGRTLAA
ncbi:MAG: sensor domain-containing diguanylate cyclase [Pseudolabrys sp.]